MKYYPLALVCGLLAAVSGLVASRAQAQSVSGVACPQQSFDIVCAKDEWLYSHMDSSGCRVAECRVSPPALPDGVVEGMIIKTKTDARIFRIENGLKRWIKNQTIFEGNRFSQRDVITVPDKLSLQIPLGNPIATIPYGTFVADSRQQIFLISDGLRRLVGKAVKKQLLPSPRAIVKLRSEDDLRIYPLGEAITTLDPLPSGLILRGSGQDIFVAEAGTLRRLSSRAVYFGEGHDPNLLDVIRLADRFIGKIAKGKDITAPHIYAPSKNIDLAYFQPGLSHPLSAVHAYQLRENFPELSLPSDLNLAQKSKKKYLVPFSIFADSGYKGKAMLPVALVQSDIPHQDTDTVWSMPVLRLPTPLAPTGTPSVTPIPSPTPTPTTTPATATNTIPVASTTTTSTPALSTAPTISALSFVTPTAGTNWQFNVAQIIQWTGGASDWQINLILEDPVTKMPVVFIVTNLVNNGTYSWTVPTNFAAGQYRVRIACTNCASDTPGAIADSPSFAVSYSSNSSSSSSTLALPDFIISDFTSSATTTVFRGQLITASSTVINQGIVTADVSYTAFCLDLPSCLSSVNQQLGAKYVKSLRPGVSQSGFNYTWDSTFISSGSHTFYACANTASFGTSQITESIYTNNCSTLDFSVN